MSRTEYKTYAAKLPEWARKAAPEPEPSVHLETCRECDGRGYHLTTLGGAGSDCECCNGRGYL